MRAYQTGMFARSLAGHDSGKRYIIIAADESTVYLADGRTRTLDKLKKKNLRHVQVDYSVDEKIRKKLEKGEALTDEDLKQALAAKDRLEKEGKTRR